MTGGRALVWAWARRGFGCGCGFRRDEHFLPTRERRGSVSPARTALDDACCTPRQLRRWRKLCGPGVEPGWSLWWSGPWLADLGHRAANAPRALRCVKVAVRRACAFVAPYVRATSRTRPMALRTESTPAHSDGTAAPALPVCCTPSTPGPLRVAVECSPSRPGLDWGGGEQRWYGALWRWHVLCIPDGHGDVQHMGWPQASNASPPNYYSHHIRNRNTAAACWRRAGS